MDGKMNILKKIVMSKRLFFLALLIGLSFLVGVGSSQSPTTPVRWAITYCGFNLDEARSVQQTSDGGYIMAGFTSSFGTLSKVWVLKLDGNGDFPSCSAVNSTNVTPAITNSTVNSPSIITGNTSVTTKQICSAGS